MKRKLIAFLIVSVAAPTFAAGSAVSEDVATSSAAPGTTSHVAIEASTEKTAAKMKIAGKWVNKTGPSITSAFSAQTPFDSSKADHRDLGSLSGLTAGTSVSLQTGFTFWPPADTLPTNLCDQLVRAAFGEDYGYQPDDLNAAAPKLPWPHNLAYPLFDLNCGEQLFTEDKGLKRAANNHNSVVEETTKQCKALKECTDAKAKGEGLTSACAAVFNSPNIGPDQNNNCEAAKKESILVVRDGAKKSAEALRAKWRDVENNAFHPVHSVLVQASGNRQKFARASTTDPAKVVTETKYGVGAALGWTMILSSSVLNAGVSFERSYEGGKETQICNPIGTTGSLSCANGALTAPKGKSDQLLFAEGRMMLVESIKLAVSPRVEYSLKDSTFGVRVPIYLAFDPKHVLDGGIALGWSNEDRFGASVFVGKAFNFFGD